ncbi:tripartite tricarboxylate transporter TctB family protein [Marivita hallyeonensis]|uniref:Tripartite tricarboxylate transporter TctB family protein n=1 Tax=Marivita hallyeonensis TaxID=996342 RepID=A0A1M5S056_9RHOB|nr:tripartite tricarboxylate transporter TctB family protein [Marivita hallyeonensis]SHH31443.1 Tripartite tricarboxylate transporter TctB family protein [Marivita hallyeonensis]
MPNTEMKTPDTLRPGERLFALLLVLFAGYAFWESYRISGLDGLTTGGVLPMLASAVMLVTGLVILSETLRKPRADDSGISGLVAYLLPLRVVLFTALVAVYVAVIPVLGFLPASGGLLFIAIWALWRKGPLRSMAISLLSVGVIYLLFRVVFQVVLPMGSLWQ